MVDWFIILKNFKTGLRLKTFENYYILYTSELYLFILTI